MVVRPEVVDIGLRVGVAHRSSAKYRSASCFSMAQATSSLTYGLTSCAPQYPWLPEISPATAISCTRHAMTTFSSSPCCGPPWHSAAYACGFGPNRSRKKSSSAGARASRQVRIVADHEYRVRMPGLGQQRSLAGARGRAHDRRGGRHDDAAPAVDGVIEGLADPVDQPRVPQRCGQLVGRHPGRGPLRLRGLGHAAMSFLAGCRSGRSGAGSARAQQPFLATLRDRNPGHAGALPEFSPARNVQPERVRRRRSGPVTFRIQAVLG